jgi:hypothetical protein
MRGEETNKARQSGGEKRERRDNETTGGKEDVEE